MAKDPRSVAEKWQNRSQNSVAQFVEGVNRHVQGGGNPAQAAVAQKQTMLTNFQNAVNSGKWEQALLAVSPQMWAQRTAGQKGQAAYQNAVSERGPGSAVDKMQQFMQDFLPFLDQVRQGLPARGGDAANERRMTENMRRIKGYRKGMMGGISGLAGPLGAAALGVAPLGP